MTVDLAKKTDTATVLKKPETYVVVVLNDDFTTFDAVIYILANIFHKTFEEAEMIARDVHEKGKGIAGGPFQYDVAETKATVAMDIAKEMEMPLKLVVERV